MRDITDQVAAYMDAVVERVDVEDLDAQVTVRPRNEKSRLVPHLRWALAGATAVFAAIGAVAVFEWIVRTGNPPFADGGPAVGNAVAAAPFWVLAVGAVAAGSVLTAGLFVTFAAVGQRVRNRGEKKMQTVERKGTETAAPEMSPLRRSLFGAAIVVLVMAVGFGTWMLVDEYTGVDRQIDLLLEDYNQAWETGDGEGAVAMLSPMGVHYNPTRPDGVRGSELSSLIEATHNIFPSQQYRNTGEAIITETTNEYLVMVPARVGTEAAATPGFSFFVIADVDGELEIRQHHWIQR